MRPSGPAWLPGARPAHIWAPGVTWASLPPGGGRGQERSCCRADPAAPQPPTVVSQRSALLCSGLCDSGQGHSSVWTQCPQLGKERLGGGPALADSGHDFTRAPSAHPDPWASGVGHTHAYKLRLELRTFLGLPRVLCGPQQGPPRPRGTCGEAVAYSSRERTGVGPERSGAQAICLHPWPRSSSLPRHGGCGQWISISSWMA